MVLRISFSWRRISPLGSLSANSSVSKTWRISTSVPPSNGARLSHSTASSNDFTCQSQKPATSSLVSANGPSVTVRFLPSNLMRLPYLLDLRPSPASITPAFTSCSLKFPISLRIFSSGSWPDSDSLFAFTITMTRIVVSFGFVLPLPRRRTGASEIDTSVQNNLERAGVALFARQVQCRTPWYSSTVRLRAWIAGFRWLHEKARHGALPPEEAQAYTEARDDLAAMLVAAQRLTLNQ